MLLPLRASHGCLADYVRIRGEQAACITGLQIIILFCLYADTPGRLQAFKACLPVWLQSVLQISKLETGKDNFLKTDQDAVLLAC